MRPFNLVAALFKHNPRLACGIQIALIMRRSGVRFPKAAPLHDRVRFRRVELDGPTVDSMFVDVPFTCRDDAGPAEFLREVVAAHPADAAVSEGFVVIGAAQGLLHPGWSGNALVVAGPGQGKSTLLQFLCPVPPRPPPRTRQR